MKEEITIKDTKEIIKEITNQEKEKSNLDINLNPVTIVEYYKTDTFKKKLKLNKNPIAKFMNFMLPYEYRGWYDLTEKNIFIILNHYTKENNSKKYNSLIEVIFTTYHEIQHQYQDKYPRNYYYSFLMELEKNIVKKNSTYYINNHDKFLIEIDANLYGITNTIEYLKKYPIFYQKNKEYLEKMQSKYLFDCKTYDAKSIFEEFNTIMKKDSKKILKEFQLLNLFYKPNGKFKSLSEILTITKEYNINPEITELIIGSRPFIKQLNFKNLTITEKEYLIYILENLYQKEAIRQEIIKENNKKNIYDLKQNLALSKNILEQIKWNAIIFDKLIENKIEKLENIQKNTYYQRIPYKLLKKI